MPGEWTMIDDLRALAESDDGKKRLRAAFDLFGVKAKAWSALAADEIANVWGELFDGFTSPESPEGREQIARLDSIKF